MSFRFSWVLIFLIIQFALWLYWYFNQKDKDFIFKGASKQVKTTINKKDNAIFLNMWILPFSGQATDFANYNTDLSQQ